MKGDIIMKIITDEQDILICCAFRYALGRRTYVVSAIVDYILKNWENFSPYRQEMFQKEIIDYEKAYGNLGQSVDKEQWYKILKKVTK